MAEELNCKSKSNYSRRQIYERDPLNEPSMQLESMAELDDLDQIGGDMAAEMSLSQYTQRLHQSQLAISKMASAVHDPDRYNHELQKTDVATRKKSKVVQLGRNFDRSRASLESKDHPTIEQSNPRVVDETFNQLQNKQGGDVSYSVTQNAAEDLQESCCLSMSQADANQKRMQHNKPYVADDGIDQENIGVTVGNDTSQIGDVSHNFNSRIKQKPNPQQVVGNRRQIQVGAGNVMNTQNDYQTSEVMQTSIEYKGLKKNIPYAKEEEVRLDFANSNREEFPYWEVQQKKPVSIDLSLNQICEWPDKVHFEKKCRSLEILIIQDNFLNRIPGYIVWTYSHLKKLDLRNNQIESMPTLSKRQSILKYVEHLDLGQNRLKLFPTSFIMSIGHGDSNKDARSQADENSSMASASEHLNSGSATADDKFNQIRLTRLKALYLDGNQLESIPAEIADHENLQILHLQDNRLAEIPASIFMMPGLRDGQLGIEWLSYVNPPLQCPFPPVSAPSDTMSVFMDLAMQLCMESQKISNSGQVKFLQFVDYFSQKQDSDHQNPNNPQLASTMTLLTETHDFYEQLISQTIKVESHLKKAASLGHLGVINSLLGSEKAQSRYKEGQFRLAQRKLDLFGEDTTQNNLNGAAQQHQYNADELSPLAIALLEHQNQAALTLINAGADQTQGFGTFGTALHLAVVQANHVVMEHLLRQNLANIDIRNGKFETPLHIVMQKLSTQSGVLDMIVARSHIRQSANHQAKTSDKVAQKIKNSSNLTIQAELRLKAIAEQLIMSGAELTANEQSGWSYVHIVSKSFNSDTLRWMLATNVVLKQLHKEPFDFEQPGGSKGWTPLHVACYTGSFEVIEELIEHAQCNVFSRSLNNKLPRQVARNTIVAKVLRIAERKVINNQLNMESSPSPQYFNNKPQPKPRSQRNKDSTRHNYRVDESKLLYQQLMDQEPALYAMEKTKARNQQNVEKIYQNTNSLKDVLNKDKTTKTLNSQESSQSLARLQETNQKVSAIQIDRQKYVSLSSTLRKCKAIKRKKDIKYEQKAFVAQMISQNPMEGDQNNYSDNNDDDDNDQSVASVSSCCFSEEILQEQVYMRAN